MSNSDFRVLDEPVTERSCILTLATTLMCRQEVSRRDWTGVAIEFGFNAMQITIMEQYSTEPNKGWLLLKTWDDMGKGSLRLLFFALLELNMGECLDTLKQDPAITDECYQKVFAEYQQLKQDGILRNIFPKFSHEDVCKVLFPHVRPRNVEPIPSCPPRYAQPEQYQVAEQFQRLAVDDRPRQERIGVFISYCPESKSKFTSQLHKFAVFVRNLGYTVYFEPFCTHEIRQCGGLDFWKEMCIKKSEDVIIVCTPEYFKEDQKMMDGSQSKIAVESHLLRQLAYSSEYTRLIPVVFDKVKICRNNMPRWLQSAVLYKWPSNEEDLSFCLAKQSKWVFQAPRKKKVLKPKTIDFKEARKHNPYK